MNHSLVFHHMFTSYCPSTASCCYASLAASSVSSFALSVAFAKSPSPFA
jgi:hypothetical protein